MAKVVCPDTFFSSFYRLTPPLEAAVATADKPDEVMVLEAFVVLPN